VVDDLRVVWLAARLALRAGGWRVAVVLLCNVALAVQPSVNALALKALTDAALARDWTGVAIAIGVLALMVAATFSIYGIFVPIKVTVSEHAARLFEQDLMTLVATIPTLEPHESPEFVDRLDVLRRNPQALVGALWTTFQNLSFFVGAGTALGLLAAADPVLLALPLFGVPLLAASRVSLRRREAAVDDTAESARLSTHLFDLATSPAFGRELRVFRLGDVIAKRHLDVTRAVNRRHAIADLQGALLSAGAWTLFIAAWAGAITVVAVRARAGEVSAGDVVLAISVAGVLQGYVSGVIGLVRDLGHSLAMAERFVWLTRFARATTGGSPPPPRLASGIELRSVSFSYPGTDTEALRDVVVTLPAGTTVAMVGENGAGKSTAVKLLLGLYAPARGRVVIDDVDLAALALEDWRRSVSGVFQDYARFEFLTREAIGVGDVPRMDQTRAVRRAIDRAGARTVPELGQQLGRRWDNGIDLSVGQWQQLALARGMMRDAPLLRVLDEPAASIDADTEYAMFERYRALSRREAERGRGAITILVSHRFSTVRMADMILVFDKGRIIERGSHEHLMALDGLYAELYRLQARAYRP
jgi:ATP-binding cassette, subfamily B, bacterial